MARAELDQVSTASWRERRDAGRALRREVPRSAHADGGRPAGRDPIGLLAEQARQRHPDLIGLRHARMAASPFGFLRGAALVMAADLTDTPSTGQSVQLCGDAHIRNFGTFATPERNLTFSINDFDETLPGPWEWDVKRFAASLYVVAEQHGFPAGTRRDMVVAAVRSYRRRIASYAAMSSVETWYDRKDVDDLLAAYPASARPRIERDMAKAHRRNHERAIAKLTETVDGAVRFRDDPPLQVRLERTGHDMSDALAVFDAYRASLSDDLRVLMSRFTVVDVARRVVGVGSVGMLVWVCLLRGPDREGGDDIVLQIKQAQASALEPYVGASEFRDHGRRVVAGQRLIQGPTDIFLGWYTAPSGRCYYVRQLWDRKGRSDLTTMDLPTLGRHANLCAWALARAHARSGDAVVLSGYLGKSDAFDRAVAAFAQRYAATNEADHRALLDAIADGDLAFADDPASRA